MKMLYGRCAGLDVHKKTVQCLHPDQSWRKETSQVDANFSAPSPRTWSDLRDWLRKHR